jgi:hypothetical protein
VNDVHIEPNFETSEVPDGLITLSKIKPLPKHIIYSGTQLTVERTTELCFH